MLLILSLQLLSKSLGLLSRQKVYYQRNDLKKQKKTPNLWIRMKKASRLPRLASNFIKKEAKKLRICKTTLSMSLTRLLS